VSPRLYLALDNCFASKRWTAPADWMRIAADLGVYAIEASADNECDPLYTPPDALATWIAACRDASALTGVRVANLYSGHGSYTTLALGHPDPRVRDHIQHNWLERMIDTAAALGAGLGFYCHAFPQNVLADPACYTEAESDLFVRLAAISQYAAGRGLHNLSVEQMYSPHQPPWTIAGARRFMQEVYRLGAPLYLTLDTGHQIGQRGYLRPDRAQVEAYVAARRRGNSVPYLYLGPLPEPDFAHENAVARILESIEQRLYLFAEAHDGDPYAWLRALGRFAPIIHLQQTDGYASAHRPFTVQYNGTGIIDGEKVLAALADSYAQPPEPGFPPPCEEIYLTIEMFSGTAQHPAHIVDNLRETVAYWRRFVPEDGMALPPSLAH
jgi:sugar phosphate isomerase/epimerase